MAASIDEQFIEYIVKSLVNNPDEVKIKRTIDEKGVLLELEVDPEDLGRVIGKRGATAQSLRTLLRALGTKNDARYNLKIVDTGEPGGKPPRRRDDDDTAAQDDTSSTSDEPVNEEIVEDEVTEEESVTANDDTSDVVSRTREELAELDDLDV